MSLLHLNDLPARYPDSYYTATAPLPPQTDCLNDSIDTDICIIGGGYTGLSAALTLAEKGYHVTLVDAHRVGWGASGRNGGQLGSGQRLDQDSLEQKFGQPQARYLWEQGEAAKNHVKHLLHRYQIEADLSLGLLYADHKPSYSADTKAYVEKLQKDYNYSFIDYLSAAQLQDHLGSDAYYGASYDRDAGHLHPLKFCLGLAKAAKQNGVTVYEDTEVIKLDLQQPDRVNILTKSSMGQKGKIRARQVIYGCNGYGQQLIPEIDRHVMPINNFILATETLGAARAKTLIKQNAAVADSRFVVNYFRLTPDHRLLFGGGETYGYKFPAALSDLPRQAMLEIFPDLQDIKIDYAWGGTLAITVNRLPYIRQIGRNCLAAAGFSGHGVAMASYAGHLLAEACDHQLSRFNIFADIPHLAFPGGPLLRHPLLVLGMLAAKIRDRF